MIMDNLRAQYSQHELLTTFGVHRSTYRYYRQQVKRVDHERDRLKAKVISVHNMS